MSLAISHLLEEINKLEISENFFEIIGLILFSVK